MKIAILGWGSLLWDKRPEFDEHHDEWQFDSPSLKIEFSRVSETRKGALTLVLDTTNGSLCQVAYTLSKRMNPEDAICDLRCREGTVIKNIGFYFADNSQRQSRKGEILSAIQSWAFERKIDVVVWTNLESNFEHKSSSKTAFSVESALEHIKSLDSITKANAEEYIRNAPKFVKTPFRDAYQF